MLPLWTALAVQASIGIVIFWIGRWRWLWVYAIALPFFWLVPILLASLHCIGCEYAAWFLPILYLGIAIVRKAAVAGRVRDEQETIG